MLKIITDLKQRIKERNNPLTAEYAYTLRKYDRKLTEEQVFHRAVETINDNIKERKNWAGSVDIQLLPSLFRKFCHY